MSLLVKCFGGAYVCLLAAGSVLAEAEAPEKSVETGDPGAAPRVETRVDTSKWDTVSMATNRGQESVNNNTAGIHKWSGADYGNPKGGPGTSSVKIPPLRQLVRSGPPRGMNSISGGEIVMGQGFVEPRNMTSNTIVVIIRPYYMDANEVSGWRWRDIRSWALTHGYVDLGAGQMGSKADGSEVSAEHPIVKISWYDAVKWCNARSEMEGLVPVYYTDDVQKSVYRTGIVDIQSAHVDWNANGYRLPTEAEWEHAAQGGRKGAFYPWGDSLDGERWAAKLDGTKANYMRSGDAYDDGTTPITYYNGNQVVDGVRQGAAMINDYGQFDMAGNVYEWCWNWFGPYSSNPSGPETGKQRVMRGGCWKSTEKLHLTCMFRNYTSPSLRSDAIGLRCVRKL